MIKDAQIRGSFGFCLRRHGGRILAGKLDLRIASSTRSAVPSFPARERAGRSRHYNFNWKPFTGSDHTNYNFNWKLLTGSDHTDSTFWDLLTTGDDRSEAYGWLNGRRRTADSSVRYQRCRNGVERICTFRSRSSTRSSRKSCEATTGITGSLETSTASWNSGREREGSGDVNCLGDAEAGEVTWAQFASSGEALQSSPRPSGPRPAEQRSEVMR